jgi:hypothetical protein
MTSTYTDIATRTNTQIPDHLTTQATPPVLDTNETGIQGDVMITPTNQEANGPATQITGAGVNVVTGDIGRNRHILNGDGTWRPGPTIDRDRDYGTLTVPTNGIAYLTHSAEHGSIGIPAGCWRLLGQLDPHTGARVAD